MDLGRKILVDLIERARAAGFHSIIGGVSADQTASVALQEALGFKRVAHLIEVGFKFGRRLDVIYLQLMLSAPSIEQLSSSSDTNESSVSISK